MNKISVLIPVFNRENYIEEAVRSIMEQTYSNLEILICDDGSSDNSVQIIEKLIKEDNRIRLIKNGVNKGIGYTRNELLKESTSEIITHQDSDDYSHPEKISKQLKLIKEGNDIVFSNWKWFSILNNKKVYKQTHGKCSASIMYKKDLNINYKSKLKISGEDIDFINRYIEKHPKVKILKDVLYFVRFHEDRIGVWKRKFRKIPPSIRKRLSYNDLIKYYKKHYEGK